MRTTQAPPPAQRYSAVAIGLHWVMAGLLGACWGVGSWMTELAISPRKLQWYAWHKWAGVSIFLLLLVRLGWRFYRVPPPLPVMPVWQSWAARLNHALLYVLMAVVPLSGWLFSSAAGFTTVWFGLWTLPNLVAKDANLQVVFRSIHDLTTSLLAILVVLHGALAIKHHWLDRDRLLARMIPGLQPRSGPRS